MAKAKSKIQITNRRASFDYEFLEQYDAGIVLVGTEIKSLRAGKASLQDAYCYFANGELYVRGMNIATYFWASWGGHDPVRDRKLLLTKPCSTIWPSLTNKITSASRIVDSLWATTNVVLPFIILAKAD